MPGIPTSTNFHGSFTTHDAAGASANPGDTTVNGIVANANGIGTGPPARPPDTIVPITAPPVRPPTMWDDHDPLGPATTPLPIDGDYNLIFINGSPAVSAPPSQYHGLECTLYLRRHPENRRPYARTDPSIHVLYGRFTIKESSVVNADQNVLVDGNSRRVRFNMPRNSSSSSSSGDVSNQNDINNGNVDPYANTNGIHLNNNAIADDTDSSGSNSSVDTDQRTGKEGAFRATITSGVDSGDRVYFQWRSIDHEADELKIGPDRLGSLKGVSWNDELGCEIKGELQGLFVDGETVAFAAYSRGVGGLNRAPDWDHDTVVGFWGHLAELGLERLAGLE
ncbi:hypothetical protein LTR84_005969 [Exophiala bonariae]|uniref:Uncharacterized protein n=1 Tax=Exophiala bonariae TaxID=1690606 RepID=A0AAV9N6F2_9EURO|nr:hypothetical protein LTR84_005969 [Exophiala bonariae]